MQVSIREFKTHLSKYLTRARAGQPIEITWHRKVVARVIGVPPLATEGLARLLATGAGQWSGGKPAGAEVRLSDAGRPVSALVLEDRG
jgi:prevent-host-death family protein